MSSDPSSSHEPNPPQPAKPPAAEEVKRLRQKYGLDKSAPDGIASYSAAGMEMAMIVVVMGAIGWGLDKLLHASPWLLLTCLLAGVVGAMTRLILRFGRVK